MKTASQIRAEFIDFFVKHQHEHVRSAPVIPNDDPTLLFTNAGMNQFKGIFLGLTKANIKRAVDTQKCIRAGGKHNDLEEVGYDSYHHTFFEMLGNWSFGDYYKKEAITWAWQLLTDVWGLPKQKLFVTCHTSDTEAFELWKSCTDIEPSHISYHGDKDNFWEMGDTGPCGPCSEIHIDRGEQYCNKKDDPNHVCQVNGDCHRYIELWNLVFMQFNRNEQGELEPLPQKFVDTGAGFERLCQVLQGKSSNYDTDLFMPILHAVAELSGVEYDMGDAGVNHRVIADHIRCLCFAIADGGLPSNEGRGYVLRRILRRAARYGRLLGLKQPFMHKLADTVAKTMGDYYVELNEKLVHIKTIIKAEEERFNTTLDRGLELFAEITAKLSGDVIPGNEAFMLYDTYGFPLDLTQVLARERGLQVDEQGFKNAMEQQRERARQASNFKLDVSKTEWTELNGGEGTEFVGYQHQEATVKVRRYSLNADGQLSLVLDQTPFYAESGGQVADQGTLTTPTSTINITNVVKDNGQVVHLGQLVNGQIEPGEYKAQISSQLRAAIAANHTATHLLHAALRAVVGTHVQQKGSLVNPQMLRFDFTHFAALTPQQIAQVEQLVNTQIRACLPVCTQVKDLEQARAEGATALFGEKYDDLVRVVSIGEFSTELCGGTHINYTGQIGLFKILTETSSSAGVRRIEAVTGQQALNWVDNLQHTLGQVAQQLACPNDKIIERLDRLSDENRELKKEIATLQQKAAGDLAGDLIAQAQQVKNIKLVAAVVKPEQADDLKTLADKLRDKLGSGIVVLGQDNNGKASLLVAVTKDLTSTYKAGALVGQLAPLVDGRGGGRPDMAMAGGKNPAGLADVIAKAAEIL